MRLQASKKAIEENRKASILVEQDKAVELSPDPRLEAQKAEFETWLGQKVETSNFGFFIDMLKKVQANQVLTPNMEAALRKCIAQDTEREKVKDNPPEPVKEEDLPTVTLKMKKFWTQKMELGSRVITGKIIRETAKALYIKGHADMVEGTWCMRCGKELTEPASMLVGFGPTCCEKLGVPYPENIKIASKKERKAIRKKLTTILHNQTFESWVPRSQIEKIIEDGEK